MAYLAAQKAKESLPDPFMQRVREAARIVAQNSDDTMQPLKELLSILVASPEQHYLGNDDSSSNPEEEGSDVTEELLGRTGEEDMGGVEAFEEERRQEIAEARQRLVDLQRSYQKDLDTAVSKSAPPQAIKRRLGEDEAKQRPDATMEEEETEGLTPEQVVASYKPLLKSEAEELRSLEIAAAKELILVGAKQSESTTALATRMENRSEAVKDVEEKKVPSSSPSIPSSSPSSGDEGREREITKKVRSMRWGGQPSVEAQLQMLAQERMQKQQEVERIIEMDKLQRMAVVRRVAGEMQSRLRPVPY